MAPWFSTVYLVGILIPALFFAVRYLLLFFFRSLYRSLSNFRARDNLRTAEAPAAKDGLDIVWEGSDPEVDLIAVHGLGANPLYAWTADVGSKDRMNWLKDLLPDKIPKTRIMTFSFESRWLWNAPKKRSMHCAAELLEAVHNKRQETKTANRPIIFMGHSFGGNVIERAIVTALVNDDRRYIPMATAAILFFGTPHRGSKNASWAEIIVKIGQKCGFDSHDGIIKDLKEESENQVDLLHQFSCWLRRMSVEDICFFELSMTDYGRKIGLPSIHREIVVTESSACIDGCTKVSLDVDHLHLTQFKSPDDPSYKKVSPIIKRVVDEAPSKIKSRLNPRPAVFDDSLISPTENAHMKLKCLHALLLTEAEDDLEYIRRTKGDRVKGTCEWVLVSKQYAEWLTAERSQLLRLTGSAGVGKTMIASFLVDEIKERTNHSGSTLFAFFFCDNKNEGQRTATVLIRALMVQLLRQQPSFFDYVLPEYDKFGEDKFKSEFCMNFDGLWRVFKTILRDPKGKDPKGKTIFVLIDGLDECEERAKVDLAKAFDQFFCRESDTNNGNLDSPGQSVKFVITHRPEQVLEKAFSNGSKALRLEGESGRIKSDLTEFIREKTEKLRGQLNINPERTNQVRAILEKKAEGTFLWVSLVLEDLGKLDFPGQIMEYLEGLPPGLPALYERILRDLNQKHIEVAHLILRIIYIAHRPLTVKELAMACLLGSRKYDEKTILTHKDLAEHLDEWIYGYRCCGAFLKLEEESQTVHLVHQSAKDFLKTLSMPKDLAACYQETSKLNLLMLHICWRYLSVKEFRGGEIIARRQSDGMLNRQKIAGSDFYAYCFLNYAYKEWEEHAIAAYPAWMDEGGIDRRLLDQLQVLRDFWLLRATNDGQLGAVSRLLDDGADIEVKNSYGFAPLSWAAGNGHLAVVELLLEKGAHLETQNKYGQTPLSWAAEKGHTAVVDLLLEKGADLETKDRYGLTPLSWAAEKGHLAIVKLLLEKGADLETKDKIDQRPLSSEWAFSSSRAAARERRRPRDQG